MPARTHLRAREESWRFTGMEPEALGWVETAVEGGFTNYPWLAQHEVAPGHLQLRNASWSSVIRVAHRGNSPRLFGWVLRF